MDKTQNYLKHAINLQQNRNGTVFGPNSSYSDLWETEESIYFLVSAILKH